MKIESCSDHTFISKPQVLVRFNSRDASFKINGESMVVKNSQFDQIIDISKFQINDEFSINTIQSNFYPIQIFEFEIFQEIELPNSEKNFEKLLADPYTLGKIEKPVHANC